MNKIILIGGAPTVGKTYIAKKLGKELKIPWISTDLIRDQIIKSREPSEFPYIFKFKNRKPEDVIVYFKDKSSEEVTTETNLENAEVWTGVRDFIDEESLGNSYIIEGMGLLPEKINELQKTKNNVFPIYIVENDVDRIREVIYTRGLWDDAFKYSDSIKEKEVEWVKSYNNWIIEECKKYSIKYIQMDLEDKDFSKKIIDLIT